MYVYIHTYIRMYACIYIHIKKKNIHTCILTYIYLEDVLSIRLLTRCCRSGL